MREFEVDKELKESYLENANATEESKYIATFKLLQLDSYEFKIGKSISDWNHQDLCDFLMFCDSKNTRTLLSTYENIRAYARYSITKKDYKNIMPGFEIATKFMTGTIDEMIQFVNKTKALDNFLTEKEYKEILSCEAGANHLKAYMVILWNGIVKSQFDVCEIQLENIDFENHRMRNFLGDWVDIKEDEFEHIKNFNREQMYSYDDVCINKIEGRYGSVDRQSSKLYHKFEFTWTDKNPARRQNEFVLNYMNKPSRPAFNDFTNYIGKSELSPKGIIKSGVYNRLIKQNEITKENLSIISVQDLKRQIPTGLCAIVREEIGYILEKM